MKFVVPFSRFKNQGTSGFIGDCDTKLKQRKLPSKNGDILNQRTSVSIDLQIVMEIIIV